jgi:NADH dehydrogenase
MPQRVVILGGGFAGMNVARHLERSGRSGDVAVTLINRENYMLFTPMLPEISSGAVEARHIAPALRAIVPHTAFEMGDVASVDVKAKQVTIRRRRGEPDRSLDFDHLVIALGAENSTHGIPGAEAHTLPFKTLADAIALRDATITSLENAATATDENERAALTTFVVVGGGFTGVELGGEMLAFIRSASEMYPHIERTDIRLVLVAGSAGLLEQLPAHLGEHAHTLLARRGIEIVLDDDVASVDAGGISLRSGKRIASRTVIWSAGVRPATRATQIDVKHSKHGAIVVNADLSVAGSPGVWALGDCAQVLKPDGKPFPQTAQHAVHQARLLARNLLAGIAGRRTKPYTYRAVGVLASLGAHEGLAEFGGRVAITGVPAWFLWRSYYLSQLPGNDRKARVAFDWTLDLPFPHDIASVR